MRHIFREKIDVSTVADATIQILVYAESLKSKVTALKLIDALLGKGPCKISSWKKPPANIPNKVSLHGVGSFHHLWCMAFPKELNHLAAILQVYAGGLNFMK